MTTISAKPIWAVFLDVDGVLNSYSNLPSEVSVARKALEIFPGKRIGDVEMKTAEARFFFCKKAVACLSGLVERISAVATPVIILSSAWRNAAAASDFKEKIFKGLEFAEYIIDKTPDLSYELRWQEISLWLSGNGERNEIERFVILDDDDQFPFPKDQFVQVDGKKSLSEENVEEAWKKLQVPLPVDYFKTLGKPEEEKTVA